MPDGLLPPVAVVAVDHREHTSDDLAVDARDERTQAPPFRERTLAGQDRELERDECRPAYRALRVDLVVEEQELRVFVDVDRRLDRERHVVALPRPFGCNKD